MKFTLATLLILLFNITLFSQTKEKIPFPDNILDIGIGVGSNYGLIGARGIVGVKGTGVLLGVGYFDGFTTFSAGLQYSQDYFFTSIVYGPFGSYYIDNYGDIDKGILEGLIISLGGRINLLKSKIMFLELGAGLFTGKGAPLPNRESVNEGGLMINAGLNFRINNL